MVERFGLFFGSTTVYMEICSRDSIRKKRKIFISINPSPLISVEPMIPRAAFVGH